MPAITKNKATIFSWLSRLSIRWRLIFVCTLLVVVPGSITGFLIDTQLLNEAKKGEINKLRLLAIDWQTTVDVYLQQRDRVLKREQALTAQRLKSIALGVTQTLKLSALPQANLIKEIASIQIGRSGHVFILNRQQQFILSKDGRQNGSAFQNVVDIPDQESIQTWLNNAWRLAPNDTIGTSFTWIFSPDEKNPALVEAAYDKERDWLIVAVSYATDYRSLDLERTLKDEVKSKIANQVIGNNGYTWVINSQGEYIVSKNHLRDGESILNTQDSQGNYFVKEIIDQARRLNMGETRVIDYPWKDVGQSKTYPKIAVYAYVPDWDWIIGSSMDQTEYLKVNDAFRQNLLAISFIAFGLSLGVVYLSALSLSRSISVLDRAAQKAAHGDLTIQLNPDKMTGGIEIKTLAQSFAIMVDNIRHKIVQIDQTNQQLHQENQIRKNAEKALLIQKAGVERIVEERTLALVKAKDELNTALQTSKEETNKIKAILHSIGDGVFVLDQDRRITLVNPITEQVSGYSKEELQGQIYSEKLHFYYEGGTKINSTFIDNVYSYGQLQTMSNHTVLVTKQGHQISVADSAAPIKNQNKEVIGCVVVFRDATQERQINRMKDEFISLASHQLRTPLAGMRWSTERLLTEPDLGALGDEQKEILLDIYSACKRLVEIVNGLLNISRIESGRLIIEPEKSSLEKIIQEVIKTLKLKITTKKISLNLHISPNLPELFIDPQLIRQAYLNLINNAIKYSPPNGVIEIRVYLNHERVFNEIEDHGIGIPEHNQSHLFEKFYRADNATSTDGTGLGLYLVKKIIDSSGGTIHFTSLENQGSIFCFTLPRSGSIRHKGEVTLTEPQI
jgi:PAS domain S-box-containing protein